MKPLKFYNNSIISLLCVKYYKQIFSTKPSKCIYIQFSFYCINIYMDLVYFIFYDSASLHLHGLVLFLDQFH